MVRCTNCWFMFYHDEINYEDTCTITVTENTIDDYTALDVSNVQQGQPFTLYDDALDLSNQTVFADITLDDTSTKQNVLSIGKEIDKWTNNGIRIHCYYPVSSTDGTKILEIDSR